MSENCAAVLFDMDGVTVQTAATWRRIEHEEILPEVTHGDVQPSAVRARSTGDMYAQLASSEDVTVTVSRDEFIQVFDEWADVVYRERAALLSQYSDLLADVDARGALLGLVSASQRSWVEMVLDRFELGDWYDVVVTASDIDGPAKPDPAIYRYAAADLAVSPQRCLAVEDSPHGIRAAKAAGMHCIALRGDGNESADLSHADDIVSDHDALRQRLLAHLQPPTPSPDSNRG
jgi:HAD superfamily hydrolase (TIGR01509 family)